VVSCYEEEHKPQVSLNKVLKKISEPRSELACLLIGTFHGLGLLACSESELTYETVNPF
jgi:hypothetical protein